MHPVSTITAAATALVADSDKSAHEYLAKGNLPARKLVILQNSGAAGHMVHAADSEQTRQAEGDAAAEQLQHANRADADPDHQAEMGVRPNGVAVLATTKRSTAQLGQRPANATIMDVVDRTPAYFAIRSEGQEEVRRDAGQAAPAGFHGSDTADGIMVAHRLVQLIGWVAQNGSPATFNALLNSC